MFLSMLKQPPAVGLDLPGESGPRSSTSHQSALLRLCRWDGTAGGNEEAWRKTAEALAKLKDVG